MAKDILIEHLREAALQLEEVAPTTAHLEQQIRELVTSGFLTFEGRSNFRFSIPGLGLFVSQYAAARRAFLSLASRNRYHEVLVEDLLEKALPKKCAHFSMVFCIRDTLGCELTSRHHTTAGTLLRVNQELSSERQ